MKKRITILLIIILGMIGLLKLNKDYYTFWNSNSINVTTEGVLNSKKVKIKYGNGVKNQSIQGRKRSSKYSYTLYDGTEKEQLINEYGENDFFIEYDNNYYFEFRHFKFNSNHQHDYDFHFFQKDTNIFVRINIKGRDKLKFEAMLLKL